MTLGLYRKRSAERIKDNQATFHNSQRNNLRSFVRGFVESAFDALSSFSFDGWKLRRLYSLLSASRGFSRKSVLLSHSRGFRLLVKTPKPHGPGSYNSIGPGRSNDELTDSCTAQFPQALRVSKLLAYHRKRSYRFYDLTPRIPYLVVFAVRPEISPLGLLRP